MFWFVKNEAHHRWRLHHVYTGWHTMLHVPLMFLLEWHEFPFASSLTEKKT